MTSTKEQLEAVNAAINRILTGGQRVKTKTAEVEMGSLAELRAEQVRLEQKLAAESASAGKGGRLVQGIYYG